MPSGRVIGAGMRLSGHKLRKGGHEGVYGWRWRESGWSVQESECRGSNEEHKRSRLSALGWYTYIIHIYSYIPQCYAEKEKNRYNLPSANNRGLARIYSSAMLPEC